MYGSTCADMQVDVMEECLSSIKHVVGRETANNQSVRGHLDSFTRGRIIRKLEEGRSVTSVAVEFGIAHSIVSRLWRQFQTTGTAIRGFSSGRPRGTTPANDRHIVLQARRNRRQTAGEIARHTTQATGRPISRITVARRLHGGGLFARRPVRCVPLTPAHRRRRSLWCREHQNWRDNEWGRVLFTDESRFSLSSDSHRLLIWRERGSRNHPSNIIERDRGAMGLQFLFMDDNAPCLHTVAAEQLLESEDIERMDWPARSPDLNPIEHVWNVLGRRLAARTLPPVTIRELRLALQDEWASMPQQLIDTLILSMGRRCETCLARYADAFLTKKKKLFRKLNGPDVEDDHTPTRWLDYVKKDLNLMGIKRWKSIVNYRKIGSRVGRNQTTVMRICNRWMQEGKMDPRGRSYPPQCTTSREDRQIVRMAVTHRSVTSRTVAQHLASVTHYSVSCVYHLTPFTEEWYVCKTSIPWSTFDAEPQTSPPQMVQ
ncbi:transposable element Tc1 transposase [Trichonephila clavipes]|nr:transposable element Tc1 transposase [Trichonephila clavipes]